MLKGGVNGQVLLIGLFLIAPMIHSLHENPMFVLRSGTEPIQQDLTSLKFFVLAENRGDHSVVVGLEMKKCCQEITSNDTDCESMSLHTGLRQESHPGTKLNFTMFYTNRYLYGRKGNCWLRLKSREGSKAPLTLEVQIPFDTKAFPVSPLQKIMQLLSGLTSGKVCLSSDEDPSRGCLPVNCLLKYSGFRSFFNRTRRRCQSSPTCHTVPFRPEMEKKPGNALSPISNRCKNLRKPMQLTDKMAEMQDLTEVAALSYTKYPIKVKCLHGYRNDSEELCICERGWSSRNFEAKDFNPETGIFVKCDQPTGSASRPIVTKSLIILLGLLVLLAVILCFYLPWACHRYKNRRKVAAISSELAESSTSSDSDSSATASVKSSRRGISPTPISTRAKMVEFSPLLRAEQTTRPAPSASKRALPTEGERRLSYPENFQLKPRPVSPCPAPPPTPPASCPMSASSSSTSVASSRKVPLEGRWSIPDTSDYLPCQDSLSRLVPLTCSLSADSFPRPMEPCTCCDSDPKPLVSVRVHTDDPNRNTFVTLRKFSPSDTSLSFENVQFPGPSPVRIMEIATKRWKDELETYLKVAEEPSCPAICKTSSTFSTLSEFWKEDEEAGRTLKNSKRSPALWFQRLIDSTKPPP